LRGRVLCRKACGYGRVAGVMVVVCSWEAGGWRWRLRSGGGREERSRTGYGGRGEVRCSRLWGGCGVERSRTLVDVGRVRSLGDLCGVRVWRGKGWVEVRWSRLGGGGGVERSRTRGGVGMAASRGEVWVEGVKVGKGVGGERSSRGGRGRGVKGRARCGVVRSRTRRGAGMV